MSTLSPNLFDKIQPYLLALVKCTGGSEATYKNLPENCKSTVDAYVDAKNYTDSNKFTKAGTFPFQLLEAYLAVLKRLKFVDPQRKTPVWNGKTLDKVLKELLYKEKDDQTEDPADEKQAAFASQTGGANLNQIIKLSKSEVSGFVPYHVNNIAGSYTEEYLNTLNSKIRKVDSQFGGFKKVTKEVIGSVEDLDRILRADLENQIDASVYKRYYKTYPIMSQKGGSIYIKQIWDWYNDTNTTDEEREVFNAYAEFYLEKIDDKNTINGREGPLSRGADITSGYLRINLKRAQSSTSSVYNDYLTTVRATIKTAGGVPLILLVLPKKDNDVIKLVLKYWYTNTNDPKTINEAAGLSTLLDRLKSNTGNTDIITISPDSLTDVMTCDDKVLKSLITENNNLDDDDDDGINPFTSKFNKDFKDSGPGLLKNGWRWDRSTNTVQKKEKGKWVDYNPIENPDEFKKIFNTARKCFNSFIEFKDKKQCCTLIQLLADGESEKFFNAVRENDVTINQLDTSFTDVNPITVVKMLEAFKFTKQKTWMPVYGNVYKFPNYNWWVRNVIKTSDLSEDEQKKILNKSNLQDVLDMSVAFVNNNLNLLNPHITYDSTGMTNSITDDKLAAIKIQRYIPPRFPNVYQGNWWRVTGNKLIRSSIGGLSHNKNMPLYPLLGGQHFVLSGGSNKKTEIVLDNTEIIPQFATQICNDLKLLIETLKSKNKTLSSKEMENLNNELEKFREAEVNLINKVLLINKYIKVANLLPNNEREILSENKINKLISEYYENFKDYADKDLELKGIGSYLRSILSDNI